MYRSATVAAGCWWSTLRNLGRTKPRGAGRCLWGKSAKGGVRMAHKVRLEFGSLGHSLASAAWAYQDPKQAQGLCTGSLS